MDQAVVEEVVDLEDEAEEADLEVEVVAAEASGKATFAIVIHYIVDKNKKITNLFSLFSGNRGGGGGGGGKRW